MAAVRGLPVAAVMRLVAAHTEGLAGGLFGPSSVNVLALNLALDEGRTP